MMCKHLSDGICSIATRLAGNSVLPLVSQCEYCTDQIPSQSINKMTVSLAVSKAKDTAVRHEIMKRYSNFLTTTSSIPVTKDPNSPCTYKESTTCNILKRLTNEQSISIISDEDCKDCQLCNRPKTINEFTICTSLRRILETDRFEQKRHGKLVTAVNSVIGPGSTLHRKIEFLASKKCGCETKVMLMNEMGPFACRDDIATILGWLKDATVLSGLPFVELTIKRLVEEAISDSIKLYTKYNLLQILEL